MVLRHSTVHIFRRLSSFVFVILSIFIRILLQTHSFLVLFVLVKYRSPNVRFPATSRTSFSTPFPHSIHRRLRCPLDAPPQCHPLYLLHHRHHHNYRHPTLLPPAFQRRLPARRLELHPGGLGAPERRIRGHHRQPVPENREKEEESTRFMKGGVHHEHHEC